MPWEFFHFLESEKVLPLTCVFLVHSGSTICVGPKRELGVHGLDADHVAVSDFVELGDRVVHHSGLGQALETSVGQDLVLRSGIPHLRGVVEGYPGAEGRTNDAQHGDSEYDIQEWFSCHYY